MTLPEKRLEQLVSYYLDCLAQEATGDLAFFPSNEGKTYIPFPLDFEWTCRVVAEPIRIDRWGANEEFFRRFRMRGRRITLYYGYPLHVRHIERSRKGWSGSLLEPVFLLPLEVESQADEIVLDIEDLWPRLSGKILKNITRDPEERRAIYERLGILEMETLPEGGLVELSGRLVELVPTLQPVETLDGVLEEQPRLSELSKPGLYNRAVIFVGETSPYTRGLERELRQLQKADLLARVSGTAIEHLLQAGSAHARPTPVGLLRVAQLNLEQEDAIASAMTQPLTVITGPPGTGKSQVVLNLLSSAFAAGQSVLFTSRNNQAVDVVCERLANLVEFPINIRTGSGRGRRDYQTELAELLARILAQPASRQDQDATDTARHRFDEIQEAWQRLNQSLEHLVELRNLISEADRRRTKRASKLGAMLVRWCQESWPRVDVERLRRFAARTEWWTSGRISWWHKPFRWWVRRQLATEAEAICRFAAGGLRPPGVEAAWEMLARLGEVIALAADELDDVKHINKWRAQAAGFGRLAEVRDARVRIEEELIAAGRAYLAALGRYRTFSLSSNVRADVARYKALIERLAQDQVGGKVFTQLGREQRNLFSKISSVLPVWSVTNLAVSGFFPLAAGVFDLAVIDEASQCDIPSAIPVLFRARRAVIIGDPDQLRHVSTIGKAADQMLQNRYGLVSAEDQRFAYSTQSLYDVSAGATSGKVFFLREHFRSHRHIIEFSNRHWYRGALEIATDYRKLCPPPGSGPAVAWHNVVGRTERPVGGGAVNQAEVQAVVELVRRLLSTLDPHATIGVVTPFRRQANRILDGLVRHVDASEIQRRLLVIDTAHRFQGDERDVVVFSPVVSRDAPDTAIGFLRSTSNLFNVAITRARAGLHVVGDRDACVKAGVSHLKAFTEYVAALEKATHLQPPSPIGGEFQSPWEKHFWEMLKRAGVDTVPQYPVNQYKLDLAAIRDHIQLDIEVDGEAWHRDIDGRRCWSDLIRDERLHALGWEVERFWVYEIKYDPAGVVERV
ncbi:MAG: AAA domain-containing protein, partial [Terriglobia bacterium]